MQAVGVTINLNEVKYLCHHSRICRGNFCNPTLTTRKQDTILLQYCHTLMLRAWCIRQGLVCNMHPDGKLFFVFIHFAPPPPPTLVGVVTKSKVRIF